MVLMGNGNWLFAQNMVEHNIKAKKVNFHFIVDKM